MAILYESPVSYGFDEVIVQGNPEFPVRVYYPAEVEFSDVIRPGSYPLIVFAHGSRRGLNFLCPADVSRDYARWTALVHLWARCGFVVASPDMYESEFSPGTIERTIVFLRQQWRGKEYLTTPGDPDTDPTILDTSRAADVDNILNPLELFGPFPDPVPSRPTPLGLVGHSFGFNTCAVAASGGSINVNAIVAIGPTIENDGRDAIFAACIPSLLICGRADESRFSALPTFWGDENDSENTGIAQPKYQASVQYTGHWDWFGPRGWIRVCGEDPEDPRDLPPRVCPGAWQIASELVLGFMTKYLIEFPDIPPHLLGPPGGRPPLRPWLQQGSNCAIVVRWSGINLSPNAGMRQIGDWSDKPTDWVV